MRWPLGVALVVFVLLQFRISASPIVPYGWDGAEYIEHVNRMDCVALFRGTESLGPLKVIAKLDTEFPPAMHLISALTAPIFGDSIEATARLATLWFFLLAFAVYRVGLEIGGQRAGLAAAVGVLLLPSLGGYATRYYYDIPMTALLWSMVAFALHSWRRRAALGGLITGLLWTAAALTKWTAVPYGAAMLVGVTLAVAASAPKGAPLRQRWLQPITAVSISTATSGLLVAGYLSVVGQDSSLNVMLGQMWAQFDGPGSGAGAGGSPITQLFSAAEGLGSEASGGKIAFYGLSLATSLFSPLLAAATALLSFYWLRRSRAGIGLLAATVFGQMAFLTVVVPVADERFLVSLAPCLVLSAALGWSSLGSLWQRRSGGLVLGFGLLIALEAHLGLPLLPLTYTNLSTTESVVAFELPDSDPNWHPYLLRPSTDGLIPSVTLRGLASTASVEDRGWVPARDQVAWDSATADRVWEKLAPLTERRLWVGPAKDKADAGVLGSFWLSYRSLSDGGQRDVGEGGCEAAQHADYAVTASEDETAPQVDPCMGAAQLWVLSATLPNPKGHETLALWKRRSPTEAHESTPESHPPLGSDPEVGQEAGLRRQ